MTVRTIDEIFRDFVTDGVPASGPFNPHKPDIRDTLKALTEGSENFPDNRVIRLNNANEGTANNIVVTASVAIPAAAYQVLYILNVTQENTGPVTVSGAINRDLVTNTSAPVPAGYLTPGMAVLCIDTGSTLRMLSYGDMETLLAEVEVAVLEAEAARDAAEQARDEAQNAASDAVAQGNVPIYSTRNAVETLEIPAGINAIRTNGFASVGDGGAALYKRVASEPTHAGKIMSKDGAWWELGESEINPLMFGAKGDGVTDDVAAMSAALNYFRDPSMAGLPGNLPYRNLRRTLDLAGRVYAISSGLHMERCYGLHLTNGTLMAIGTSFTPESVLIWAANPATENFNNFSISKLTLQCNQKCSGILLQNSSLYQLTDIYIYGWGATGSAASFGIKSLPAGWSSSSSIHNVVALPYISAQDEVPPQNYTGVGFMLGHNDCIITGCEVAAGYCAVRFLAGTAAIQFNDNHTWTVNPGQNPGVELNGNFGITLNGNYFDSHPVWIKGAGYYGISITNNFFLSGSPSPSAAVILESPTANFALRDIVITGNTGSGGMAKVVERYSPSGTSFSTTFRRVVIKDNPISTSENGGNIYPTATEGMVSVFVETADLSGNFTTRVDMSTTLLTTNVPPSAFKATFSLTQNDPSMADTYVTGYYYNQGTGYLHIKLNRSVPCFVMINFKIDEVGPNLNAVSI